ncbi:IS66 C-terminal element [Anaerocolumna jejuensis DSM 15929]|uniref:IS66 C-terminal element n=1 Tax=Anaerocolumna jejuensis DSM 15929 TaxID=1121322 RepID=A0A1M6ZNJ6_9FIRM|nr:transposase domain-containing protein [Anaerocolumna jejuensis]SHL31913.1 IS66 C-terminal element [Anaerocolumna jejuensis DSM 15929]
MSSSDTREGATANALYLILVEMAKVYGLNLYEYLKLMLEKRPSKDMSDDDLAKLAPWDETVQELCKIKME